MDHAQFRQYSNMQDRWMSPDPYEGSYDVTNPQSFNRYVYVGNNPLGLTDPSGLDGGALGSGGCYAAVVQGGSNPVADVACGIYLAIDAFILHDLFGHGPAFKGTTRPRPSSTGDPNWDGNFGESNGLPVNGPQFGGGGLGGLFGISSGGCEFGVCGFQQGDPLGSISVSNGISAVWGGIQGLFWFNHIPYHDLWDSNHRLFGTHYCGPGGGGSETSQLDALCHIHDDCYGNFGVSASVNLPQNHSIPLSAGQIAGITGCNQALANGARALGSVYGAAAVNSWLTNGYGFLYPGTNAH
jgi:hypothetical protein